MPKKDIKSYFTVLSSGNKKKDNDDPVGDKVKTKNTSKRQANIEDDDDVIPESPQITKQSKPKKRPRGLSSSDDEADVFVTKQKTNKINNTTTKQTKQTSNKKSPAKPAPKIINPSDFFGKAPVKRVTESANVAKKDNVDSKKKKTELGIHDDENFERTLIELDCDDGPSKTDVSKQNNLEIENDTKIKLESNSSNKEPFQSASKNTDQSLKSNRDKDPKRSKTPVKENKQKSSRTRSRSRTPIKVEKENTSSKKEKHHSSRKSSSRTPSENHRRTRSSSRTPQKTNDLSSPKKTIEKLPKLNINNDKSPSKRKLNNSNSSALEKKLAISEKIHSKKDFSAFLNDEVSSKTSDSIALDTGSSPLNNKRNLDKTTTPHSESKSKKRKTTDTPKIELTDEEREERRRYSAALYKSYQNRKGPKHPGSKEIPEGSADCLAGYAFVVTGELDCFTKEEIEEIAKRFGGDFKKGVSGKVTHLICGEDPGPAKLEQAEKLGITQLTEDQFLRLITDNTENKPSRDVASAKKTTSTNKKKSQTRSESSCKEVKVAAKKKLDMKQETQEEDVDISEPTKMDSGSSAVSLNASDNENLPWVEKYKPQSLKQVIGQQGDKSVVKKLTTWLSEWYVNRKKNLPKPNPWAGDKQGGGYYKAALLSGPPGVGKTTCVGLVCKELGFDTVEFNASDTRSKTLLKEHLTDLVSTNSLAGYYQGKTGKGAISKKHVVIMDEVDGMAGNEDRGGMQELLSLIRSTSVPMICMCNDKTSPKMRSLSSNCYDLTVARPNVNQIKGAMLSVCFKEGIKISPQSMSQIITAANQDIRQVLNLLSVWSATNKDLSAEGVDKDSNRAQKDMKLGPWDVVRKVFSLEEQQKMSIHDKSDLFFHDYSLGPLFVQQNYLKVVPKCDKKEVLNRFAEAADSLSIGDVVESKIRGNMAWSLLPLQAMYSSVLPGHLLAGHMTGQIEFPSWLGQNSRTNKMNRLTQELHSHTGLSTSGSKLAVRMDYANHLRDSIINPLIQKGTDGIPESVGVLQDYHLLREDLDSLLELTHWSGQRDPYSMVETRIKSAFTKTYNKEAAPLPYSQVSMKKSTSTVSSADSELLSSETDTQDTAVEEDIEENSDVENDSRIKVKVNKASTSSNSRKATASSSKESKGKGKGKGKK